MSKTVLRLVTFILIVGVIGYLIANRMGVFDPAPASDTVAMAGPSEAPPLPVNIYLVKPQRLEEKLNLTGTILPDESVNLTSEIAGVVKKIHFREGAYVKKDQLLLNIDDETLQAELKKVTLQITLARQQEARRKKLLEIGGISQEEYDQSLTQYNSLQAEEQLLKVQISKTRVRAPFSGTIGLRNVSEGAYLTPGMEIAQLVKTQPVKIEFSVPEKYGNRLQANTSITFTVEGLEQNFEGRVFAREPVIDMGTRTLLLKAQCNNPGGVLIPGAFANIEITLGEYEEALMIPTQALVPEQGGQKVYLYRQGNPVAQAVSTGIRQADQIQITEGLSPGDSLITSGILQIRPGVQVRPASIQSL